MFKMSLIGFYLTIENKKGEINRTDLTVFTIILADFRRFNVVQEK
jgi:hypothetical protein